MATTFGQIYPKGFCFIATATFESVEAPEVLVLRQFRDDVLLKCVAGRTFVVAYYRLFPTVGENNKKFKDIEEFITSGSFSFRAVSEMAETQVATSQNP